MCMRACVCVYAHRHGECIYYLNISKICANADFEQSPLEMSIGRMVTDCT